MIRENILKKEVPIRAIEVEGTEEIYYVITDIMRANGEERRPERRGFDTAKYVDYVHKGKVIKHEKGILSNSGLGGRQQHLLVNEVGLIEILERTKNMNLLKEEFRRNI